MKNWVKGRRGLGHVTHYLNMGPPNISGMAKDTNLKCFMRLKVRDTKPQNEDLVKRGRGLSHVTYFSNFGTPLIPAEWLKIQTSNFACELKVKDTKPKK